MAANVDDILPKASDVMMRIAEAQAEKAAVRGATPSRANRPRHPNHLFTYHF